MAENIMSRYGSLRADDWPSDVRNSMPASPQDLLSGGYGRSDVMSPGPAPTGREQIFDRIYGLMGGTPSVRPWAEKATTAFDLATMGMLTGAYDGGAHLAKTGDVGHLAMLMVPGAAPIKAGAAGAVKALAREAKRLPMDFASRMARASEQGYRMTPVYHGTSTSNGNIFRAFSPMTEGGRTSRSQVGSNGVSVALNPEVANEFAFLAAQRSGGDPAVMKLLHRTERPASLHLDGSEKNLEVAATLANAFSSGRDAVALRNYTTPSGANGGTTVVLRNPNQLRSINAAFDPDRAHEADLMASRLLPIAMGGGGAGYSWDQSR